MRLENLLVEPVTYTTVYVFGLLFVYGIVFTEQSLKYEITLLSRILILNSWAHGPCITDQRLPSRSEK